MAENITTRETLKRYFKNGKKPDETHFAAVFDSFLHKDDMLPTSKVEGLSEFVRRYGGMTREEVESMIASAEDFRRGLECTF